MGTSEIRLAPPRREAVVPRLGARRARALASLAPRLRPRPLVGRREAGQRPVLLFAAAATCGRSRSSGHARYYICDSGVTMDVLNEATSKNLGSGPRKRWRSARIDTR